MNEHSELDLAAIRLEFRKMYRDIGYYGCVNVMYELIVSANTLAEVMLEEQRTENERL